MKNIVHLCCDFESDTEFYWEPVEHYFYNVIV